MHCVELALKINELLRQSAQLTAIPHLRGRHPLVAAGIRAPACNHRSLANFHRSWAFIERSQLFIGSRNKTLFRSRSVQKHSFGLAHLRDDPKSRAPCGQILIGAPAIITRS